jgi:cell wall-associated NlpC family hydrolase
MRLMAVIVTGLLSTGCAVQLKSASHSWDENKPEAPRIVHRWSEDAPPPNHPKQPAAVPVPNKTPAPPPTQPKTTPPKHARHWLVTPPDIPGSSAQVPAEPDILPAGVSIREVPVRPQDAPQSLEWAQNQAEPTVNHNASVLEIAQAYLGVPYVFGGESMREGGFDCSGLVQQVFARKGIPLPRLANEQYLKGIAIERNQLQPGDLVFFSISGTVIDHVGFYAGDNQFLHAPRTGRVVSYDRLDSDYFQRHYQGARRL